MLSQLAKLESPLRIGISGLKEVSFLNRSSWMVDIVTVGTKLARLKAWILASLRWFAGLYKAFLDEYLGLIGLSSLFGYVQLWLGSRGSVDLDGWAWLSLGS